MFKNIRVNYLIGAYSSYFFMCILNGVALYLCAYMHTVKYTQWGIKFKYRNRGEVAQM